MALRRSRSASWRGRPFGDLADEVHFQAAATRLEEQHRLIVDRWGELALRAGTHERFTAVLADDVAAEPLRERRWATLALARYRSCDQVGALRTVADARRELVESVGVEPGPELRTLEQQLLDQDPELDWRPSQTVPTGHLGIGPVAVGRDADVRDVIDLLDRHRVVVLEGPSGMGKSTVAAEVCRCIRRPSAWVTSSAIHEAGLVMATAAALGLPTRGPGPDCTDVVARHLHRSAALLVLDDLDDADTLVIDALMAVVARAPDVPVIVTARSSLPIPHGIHRPLVPLDAGAPDDPGPAALLAADFASIPRSCIQQRWTSIEDICQRSAGIPMAIRLLAGSGDGLPPPPNSSSAQDPVGDAALTALSHLPSRVVELVTTIADLRRPVTVPLAARILGTPEAELRRNLGAASRAGLVTEVTAGDVARISVLDQVADVLRPQGPDPGTTSWLAMRMADETIELVDAAQPSLVGRLDRARLAEVDDDHDALLWALGHLCGQPRLRLANRLAVVWSACGRSLEGSALLADIEPLAAIAAPIDRVRYWVMRAQMSPALSVRAALAPQLAEAADIADRLGHRDLAVRSTTELALSRIWAADAVGATELLDRCEDRVVLDDFGRLTLATLRAMIRGLRGDVRGAIDDLLVTADAFDDGGMAADAVGVLHIALSLATLTDDDERAETILDLAEGFAPDRFTGYPVAGLTYRRAQRLTLTDDNRAGPLLFAAYAALHRHGDGQWAASCLGDLGWWRSNHGDPGGLADLATAALDLLEVWSAAAPLSLARIAVLVDRLGRPADAGLLAAAAGAHHRDTGISLSAADHEFVASTCARRSTTGSRAAPQDGEVVGLLRELCLA